MNKRIFGLLAAAIALVSVFYAFQAPSATAKGHVILEFDTMVGVTPPYTGTTNPIRGINGGGAPWVLNEGSGKLKQSGELEIDVYGLVIGPTGPAAVAGTNPVATFKATVSCQTIVNGAAAVVNVSSDPFPATLGLATAGGGDAHVKTTVALPQPCIAPIIFVANGGNGAWFAATGN